MLKLFRQNGSIVKFSPNHTDVHRDLYMPILDMYESSRCA